MNLGVRPMPLAGTWYPATAQACQAAMVAYGQDPAPAPQARFGLVPHAGWAYSGAIAARVFRALATTPGVDLAVVLGGHLRQSDSIVATRGAAWQTPFGPLPLYRGLDEALGGLPVEWEDPRAYTPENSIEVQLPFVRQAFPHAILLPLRVPPGPVALKLGRLLAEHLAAQGLHSVGLASTDLTHYGPAYDFEPKGRNAEAHEWAKRENDGAFLAACAEADPWAVLRTAAQRHNACSPGAVAALRAWVGEGAQFELLDHGTSREVQQALDADFAEPLNFVGYAGGVFRTAEA